MADRAALEFDAHQQRVPVAIDAHLAQQQLLAAGLALDPELFARAAVESDEAGLLRHRERLAVHEAEHQDFAVDVVLHDGRNQPVFFFEIEFHCVSQFSVP